MRNHCGIAFTNNPNAPCVGLGEYVQEKFRFVAFMIGVILYGVTIPLFFQSLRTLFYPTRGRVMRGLAAHTITMFLCLTMSTTIEIRGMTPCFAHPDKDCVYRAPVTLGIFGVSGALGELSPAPYVFSLPMFPLNQWLADGLLLYRCYIIYAGSCLVILPCLMYLATVVMSVIYLCSIISGYLGFPHLGHYYNLQQPYLWTCIALNVLLTLMIIARLVLHSRSIRSALGTSAGVTGVYTTIVVILTEACTPYAVALLIYLVISFAEYSDAGYALSLISSILVVRFQVIGPLFIIVRIAAGRAVTSNMTSPQNVGSIRFRSQETSTGNSEPLADENPTGSRTLEYGKAPGTPNVGREADIEEIPL